MAQPAHGAATFKHGSLTVTDGTGSPKSITVIGKMKGMAWKYDRNFIESNERGTHEGHQTVADTKVSFTLEVKLRELMSNGSGTDVSLREALTGKDQAATDSWATTGTAGFDYVTDIAYIIDLTAVGGAAANTVTLAKAYLTSWGFKEDDPTIATFDIVGYEADEAGTVT